MAPGRTLRAQSPENEFTLPKHPLAERACGRPGHLIPVHILDVAAAAGLRIPIVPGPDHIHLFIESDPRWAVAEIVNRLKGYTSRILRSEFRQLRSRLPTLWSRSYYAGTVGHVSEPPVSRYIESQAGKPSAGI